MIDPVPGRIVCPGCEKQYPWVQEFAGQRVRCFACNTPLVMPFDPPDVATATTAVAAQIIPSVDDEPVLLIPIEDDLPVFTDSHSLLSSLNQQSPPDSPSDTPPDTPLEELPWCTLAEDNEDEEGDLILTETASVDDQPIITAPDGKCPDCGNLVAETAVICTNCGFNFLEGKKLDTQVGITTEQPETALSETGPAKSLNSAYLAGARVPVVQDENHAFTEIWAPAILGFFGVALIFIDSFLILDASLSKYDLWTGPISVSVFELIARFVIAFVQIPFLFGGIIVIGMMFGTSFSSITSAILRFIGVSFFLAGFSGCLSSLLDRITGGFGGMGWMLSSSVNLGVFFAVSTWMFDLDFLEAMILYFIAFFMPPLFVFYFLAVMFA